MHIIQKAILDTLRTQGDTRYANLMPKDIESSHFRYHLLQLVKSGSVEQKARGVYGLTRHGLHEVDYLSKEHLPERMPKAITYTLLHDKDTLYLHKKIKEPYRGLLNFIGGKIHVGETAWQAAKREVAEKAELLIPEPDFVGTAEIIIYSNNELLTHVIAEIFQYELKPEDDSSKLVPVLRSKIAEEILAPDFSAALTKIESARHPFHSTIILDI